MEFLPWKTINLDGSFRVTAPESVAEEILEEVSDGVTFRFNSDLEEVRLEILLNAPWGWKECFPLSEQENPPAKFICRLISRSTGRRSHVELEDGGMDCWFTETSYKSLREGEELRVEALLVRTTDLKKSSEGFAGKKGQIIGRSNIHTVQFINDTASDDSLFKLRWSEFPSSASKQLWRLIPGEPPVVELNSGVPSSLRQLLMSRSSSRQGGALQRDAIFISICSSIWPILVSDILQKLQHVVDDNPSIEELEAIETLSKWQLRILSLFAPGLLTTSHPIHEALSLIPLELKSPGGFSRLMMRMPELIQEETKLLQLAELMANSPQIKSKKGLDVPELKGVSAA